MSTGQAESAEGANHEKAIRHVVGCMTGTSLDGLDAALVRIDGAGLDMRVELIEHAAIDLGDVADALRQLASGDAAEPITFLRAARALGERHAEAIATLQTRHADIAIDFAVCHGQTIWHAPGEHLSWQLFDPWPTVRQCGFPVCYDLRQADLVAGGQGAPITPLADWIMYRSEDRHRLVVNLGGICNITALPAGCSPEAVHAEDVGPCNLLIDGVVRALYPDTRFDKGGNIAASGAPQYLVRALVRESDFYQRPSPRTTGREDFSETFIRNLVDRAKREIEPPEDIVASAVEAVVWGMSEFGTFGFDLMDFNTCDVILAGGGARNATLVDEIRGHYQTYGHRVLLSDELEIPCEAREAMAFALLGALSHDGVPITLPQVTGADTPDIAGAWAGLPRGD